jgi:hypothetical protein
VEKDFLFRFRKVFYLLLDNLFDRDGDLRQSQFSQTKLRTFHRYPELVPEFRHAMVHRLESPKIFGGNNRLGRCPAMAARVLPNLRLSVLRI